MVFFLNRALMPFKCKLFRTLHRGDTLNALLATQESKKVRARWGPDAFSAKYGGGGPSIVRSPDV